VLGLEYGPGVSMSDPQTTERVRAAEVIAALCLGTDLGMGFPFEHGLHTTLIAMRLADRLEVGRETASQTYYASLLAHAGCTTDAHLTVEVFGGSLTTNLNPVIYGSGREVIAALLRALPDPERPAFVRAIQTVRRVPRMARAQRPQLTAHCEVAQMLAEGVGAPSSVRDLLAYLLERWDGRGPLGRAKGEEIPLPMRIVHVATDAALQRLLGGEEHAARLVRERSAHGFDPEVAARLADHAAEMLALDREVSAWDEALACEPQPRLTLEGEAIDRALVAMGGFTDLISPYLTGHSAGVSELASAAARQCRIDPVGVTAIRRAGLVHDLGRVAINARIWQNPGSLTADEWEQVRLHPYYTERVLSRSPFLSALAPIAGAHHERLDGSGYHRGCRGADLPLSARLLAAADTYRAMCEPRPYRDRIPPERAAEELAGEATAGRLDPDAVIAVIEAAGQRAPRLERPAGLTEREAEVVAMLARGLQTKQVARELGISVKTADRHVQNAYGKIGVSTRAAATLFAMEHGLVAWGELPMARPAARP
jgi:HD-GYP domain-containing protein (c-di-GMP phosphodiesterase class II)